MRLCYGWWAASYKEQSEKQLGALYDVRATSVFYTDFYAGPTALRTQPEPRACNRGQYLLLGGECSCNSGWF